jgi:hypothetical protein
LIGVEPEIVKRSEAYRIRVWISRNCFRAPGDGARVLDGIPRRAAIPGISYRTIVREAWMLRRRMKLDVTNIDSSPYGHAERLNGSIEVLVVEREFIMPHAATQIGDFVTHEPDTVVAVIRFDLAYRRARPGFDGRLLSHGVTHATKTEGRVDSGYGVLPVRSVVIHVALVGMTLAPDAFIRHDVIRFCKIFRSHV